MKKLINLLTILFVALTLTFVAPAKASAEVEHEHEGSSNTGSTPLPINNGVVFLMIAGLVIGVTVINKTKSAKLATVKA